MGFLIQSVAALFFVPVHAQTKVPDLSSALMQRCSLDNLMAGRDSKSKDVSLLSRLEWSRTGKSLGAKIPDDLFKEGEEAEAKVIKNELKTQMNTCIKEVCASANCSDFSAGQFGQTMNSLKASLQKENARHFETCRESAGDKAQCYQNRIQPSLAPLLGIEVADELSKLSNIYAANAKKNKPVKNAGGIIIEFAETLEKEHGALNRALGESYLGGTGAGGAK